MSTILAVIRRSSPKHAPTLQLQCAGCGRIYQTRQARTVARRLTRCFACWSGQLGRVVPRVRRVAP